MLFDDGSGPQVPFSEIAESLCLATRASSGEAGQNPLPHLKLLHMALKGDQLRRFGLRWRNPDRDFTLKPAVWRPLA